MLRLTPHECHVHRMGSSTTGQLPISGFPGSSVCDLPVHVLRRTLHAQRPTLGRTHPPCRCFPFYAARHRHENSRAVFRNCTSHAGAIRMGWMVGGRWASSPFTHAPDFTEIPDCLQDGSKKVLPPSAGPRPPYAVCMGVHATPSPARGGGPLMPQENLPQRNPIRNSAPTSASCPPYSLHVEPAQVAQPRTVAPAREYPWSWHA